MKMTFTPNYIKRADNSDLIGMSYRNGDHGVVRYHVVSVDSELPELIHWRTETGREGCALADFVRPLLT